VAPTAPPLYAGLALPFSYLGWRGLVAINTVSFVITVALVALTSHLYMPSHSARAAVLVPPLLVLASPLRLEAAALAFLVTMGCNYCLTFPVSSKALQLYHDVEPGGFESTDLLRIGAVLLPLHFLLIIAFLGTGFSRLTAVIGLGLRTLRVERSFLPRRVLGSPVFRSVVALGAIGMSAFLGTIVIVPIAASRAFGIDGIVLGLVLLPMALVSAASSTGSDRVQARIGRRTTTALALAALAAGAALLALFGLAGGAIGMAAILMLLGLGFGLLGAPLVNELTNGFDDQARPVALGAYYLCFFLGAGSGAAISSALVQLGVSLPLLRDGPVPGFAAAELLLAVLPAIAAALLLVRRQR
jgi:hypothetical protein